MDIKKFEWLNDLSGLEDKTIKRIIEDESDYYSEKVIIITKDDCILVVEPEVNYENCGGGIESVYFSYCSEKDLTIDEACKVGIVSEEDYIIYLNKIKDKKKKEEAKKILKIELERKKKEERELIQLERLAKKFNKTIS